MKRPLTYTFLIAAMMGMTQAASASQLQPKIIVLVPPLTSYVGGVTKNVATPQSLLTNYQDTHNFVLAPTQARMLAEAEVLIVPDLSINLTFAAIAAKNSKMKVIELSRLDGSNLLPYPATNPWLASAVKPGETNPNADPTAAAVIPKEPAAPATGIAPSNENLYNKFTAFDDKGATSTPAAPPQASAIDPHFWLDPERMAAIALPLARELSTVYPAQQKNFEANAQTLSQHLRGEVMSGMQQVLEIPRSRLQQRAPGQFVPYITYHPGYQYFLSRFSLPYTGHVLSRPNEMLGATSLEAMLKTAAATRIRCMVTDSATPTAEKIARASGARLSLLAMEQSVSAAETPSLSWVRNDFDRLLYKTAKSFADCL